MTITLTQADRDLVERLVKQLEEEGAMIGDVRMEITDPERVPVGEVRSAVEFEIRGVIERTESHD